MEVIDHGPQRHGLIETQYRRADRHPEADGKLLSYCQHAIAGAGVGVIQICQADGIHGGELRRHRHPQHEQRQDHQPQRHSWALQRELSNQHANNDGDADQRFTITEPAQHLSDGGFRHQ
ncbi:hypothetical protein D3C78_1507510 [compost metagenome]